MVNGRNNYLQRKCVEAEEAATRNQSSKLFSVIRDITGKSTTNSATNVNKKKTKKNGGPPANRDEFVEEWGNYFEELLNNSSDLVDTSNIPEASQDLNINISNFTKEELITAIKSMKNDKPPGSDEAITAEALKYGVVSLHSAILELTNTVLNQKETPK